MTPFWYDYISCVNFHIQVLFKYQKVCCEIVFKQPWGMESVAGRPGASLWASSSQTNCCGGQRFLFSVVAFSLEVVGNTTAYPL